MNARFGTVLPLLFAKHCVVMENIAPNRSQSVGGGAEPAAIKCALKGRSEKRRAQSLKILNGKLNIIFAYLET